MRQSFEYRHQLALQILNNKWTFFHVLHDYGKKNNKSENKIKRRKRTRRKYTEKKKQEWIFNVFNFHVIHTNCDNFPRKKKFILQNNPYKYTFIVCDQNQLYFKLYTYYIILYSAVRIYLRINLKYTVFQVSAFMLLFYNFCQIRQM